MSEYRQYSREDVRTMVKAAMQDCDKTTAALVAELGISQQRISEALTFLGARVVGSERRIKAGAGQRGRPFSIYSIRGEQVVPQNLLKSWFTP